MMKHMTWKKQPLLGETYDVKKSNRFRWNTWGDKGKKKQHLRQHIVLHSRSDDISFVENHILRQNTKYLKGKIGQKKATFEADSLYEIYDVKRKKEVTSETAYGSSQQKRRYIFCRKSLFTQNTKYLRGKKMATFEAASFDETYEVKKGNQFGWNIWGEKGKNK